MDTAGPVSVSVIIPTHCRPDLLRRAIRSALEQTHRDLEVIVIENGRSHDSRAIVEAFARANAPVRYLYRSEPDPHAARNAGILAARGRFCAFLDDDDEWLPEKLQRQLACFERDPRLGLVTCGAWRVNERGEEKMVESRSYHGVPSLKALVTEWCFIWSLSGVVIRRECFDRTGLFSLRYFVAGDYDLYLRIARDYPIAMVDEPLFRYRQHEGNLSGNWHRTWRETSAILRRLRPAPSLGVSRGDIRDALRRYARWYYGQAMHAREAGRPLEAVRYFAYALRHDPAIGRRLGWSRFANPMYQIARPYAAIGLCAIQAVVQRVSERRVPIGVPSDDTVPQSARDT